MDARPSADVLGSLAVSNGNDQSCARMTASDLKDGFRVHFKCMSMQHNKARNLRVRTDGSLEGHGGCGTWATWTVGLVGEHEGALVVTLCAHINGQFFYLRVAEDGKKIDGRGNGDPSCHFIMTTHDDCCVGLSWFARPSVRVRIGSLGQALDPNTEGGPEHFAFKLLPAVVPQPPALTMLRVARAIGQPQVKSKVSHTKMEVLTADALHDGLRAHLQCNGRSGDQRQNLRLCANGDIEGLGMFGKPATWIFNVVGKHNGSPIVTLHLELQGVQRFLRATKQGQKIDGRGRGGVDCQFMVKASHVNSSVALHPVVSPLARLGVGADGQLLDPFAPESDSQFSFILLLSRHSDPSDWQLVEWKEIPEGKSQGEQIELADKATHHEWSVVDGKERQSGDDW